MATGQERDQARAILAEVERRADTEFIWPMGLAMAYAQLGEESRALDFLERAYNERVGWMPLVGCESALDVLRPTARFQTLVRKVGPQAITATPLS